MLIILVLSLLWKNSFAKDAMSQNSDPYYTGMSFCAEIAAPKSYFNCQENVAIPDCCRMCYPEQENGIFEFLNWRLSIALIVVTRHDTSIVF